MDIQQTVLDFLREKTGGADIAPDTELLKSGLVNSLFALEIVVFVEKTFHLKLGRKDISPENFSSAASITALVERLGGQA